MNGIKKSYEERNIEARSVVTAAGPRVEVTIADGGKSPKEWLQLHPGDAIKLAHEVLESAYDCTGAKDFTVMVGVRRADGMSLLTERP